MTTPSPAPTATELAAKYRRSRRLNVVLVALVAFLAVVLAAEYLPGQSPTDNPRATGTSDTDSGSADSGDASADDVPETDEQASGDDADDAAELEFVRRDADDPMAIGAIDAPVVLTEWIDMRCPFCALFHRDTLPTLIEEYVDTGKVRIEFYDVAFYGDQSQAGAVAARAAAQQDKYLEYINAMYAIAPERGHAELPRKKLLQLAEEIAIPDLEQFTADLDDPDQLADVMNSLRYAQNLGVNAVPFFVANGKAMSGAQPIEAFRELIDNALAEASQS